MSFTFDIGVPATGHNPSVDYSIMQANNVSSFAILDVDHITYNALSGGTHKQCTFINKADPGIGGGNTALYSNNTVPPDGNSWPFWTNELGTFQLGGDFTASAQGQFTLPGGIIVQWGAINASSTVTGNIVFGTPFVTACYVVYTSPYYPGAVPNGAYTVGVKDNASTTGVEYRVVTSSGAYSGFYWLAIGV